MKKSMKPVADESNSTSNDLLNAIDFIAKNNGFRQIFTDLLSSSLNNHEDIHNNLERMDRLLKESLTEFRKNFHTINNLLVTMREELSHFPEEHESLNYATSEINKAINNLTRTLQIEDIISQTVDYICEEILHICKDINYYRDEITQLDSHAKDELKQKIVRHIENKLRFVEKRHNPTAGNDSTHSGGDVEMF